MSEALLSELVPRVERSPVAKGPVDGFRPNDRASSTVELTALPTVHAGQLWLVELPTAERKFSPFEFRALTTANVVIYDRALASTVARALPLGGYAEPAPASEPASDLAWERCLRFARDGWSVVRLVHPQGRVQRIQHLSKRLRAAKGPASLPVSVFANTGAGYERSEAELDGLGDIISSYSLKQTLALTIIIDTPGAGVAPRLSVVSSNGLAG